MVTLKKFYFSSGMVSDNIRCILLSIHEIHIVYASFNMVFFLSLLKRAEDSAGPQHLMTDRLTKGMEDPFLLRQSLNLGWQEEGGSSSEGIRGKEEAGHTDNKVLVIRTLWKQVQDPSCKLSTVTQRQLL
jgi:hypothetical protein